MTLKEIKEKEERAREEQYSCEEMGEIVSAHIDEDMQCVCLTYDKYNESYKTTYHTISIPYEQYLNWVICHRDRVKELYKDIIDNY